MVNDLPALAEVGLTRFTNLEAARDAWLALGARAQNLFGTWEWASTWWRHFGADRRLLGTIARGPDGEPAAILPLYLARRRPVAILRFLGHGPGDWLGPIHAPEDSELAAVALRATLAGISRWDLLLAENLLSGVGQTKPAGGAVVRRTAFPILPFRGMSWAELLAERSKNFRQQVGRRERRLARAYRLTYRLTDPARLRSDLELLFRLHESRWQSAASPALAGTRMAFHRDFAQLALGRGWLRLWVMELDDEPVAVWYGFRYAGVEWYYQSGWDPARRSESIGFVLLCHTIRAAIEDGAKEYWLLRGDEAYKDRFAEEDPGLETIVVPRGVRGRAALTAIRHLDRLPASARRRVIAGAG